MPSAFSPEPQPVMRGSETALRILMLPLLAAQGAYVRHRALILPEAAGARDGTAGAGRDLNVLIIGDSSAAGVGVDTQDMALSGQLVSRLAHGFRVRWKLEAQTGATTASTIARLADTPRFQADAVVIALGVNDCTRGTTLRRWHTRQTQLYDLLRRDYGARRLYVTAVPPLGQFPLLPDPLRRVLGLHAARMDDVLSRLLDTQPDCTRISIDLPPDPRLMAADGYHPGARVYSDWAQEVARHITSDFSAEGEAGSQLVSNR